MSLYCRGWVFSYSLKHSGTLCVSFGFGNVRKKEVLHIYMIDLYGMDSLGCSCTSDRISLLYVVQATMKPF